MAPTVAKTREAGGLDQGEGLALEVQGEGLALEVQRQDKLKTQI